MISQSLVKRRILSQGKVFWVQTLSFLLNYLLAGFYQTPILTHNAECTAKDVHFNNFWTVINRQNHTPSASWSNIDRVFIIYLTLKTGNEFLSSLTYWRTSNRNEKRSRQALNHHRELWVNYRMETAFLFRVTAESENTLRTHLKTARTSCFRSRTCRSQCVEKSLQCFC